MIDLIFSGFASFFAKTAKDKDADLQTRDEKASYS